MQDVQSYEVQDDAGYDQLEDVIALINQITEDMIPEHAGYGFKVRFHGEGQMTVVYHCFEVDLPSRRAEIEEQSEKQLSEYEKQLKKIYKSRSKKTLKLKELKDLRVVSSEKVSLNNRYYIRSTRTYEIN